MAISSIHFDGENKGHSDLIKLVNELASLRPAIPPTTLVEEVLLDELPKRIAELKAEVKDKMLS